MLTCAESLVQLLSAYGVDTVFGIPGVHTIQLYRGLVGAPMRHITPRHEQGAGFAADGYARVSGKVGVCFIITGPGMTNMATALGQAYADSVPMLVISSVNARAQLGRGNGHLHELPSQQQLFAGLTAFSHTLMTVEALPEILARAFAVFSSARPRPVHIEIPIDLLDAPTGHLNLRIEAPPLPPAPHPAALAQAVHALVRARRPLILAGGGAVAAGAALQALADTLQAPVQLTIHAKGLLPPEHPLLVGSVQSTLAGRAMVAEADVVLAVGTELSETDYDTVFDGGFKLPGQLVRIDLDAGQLMRNFRPSVSLLADAELALQALNQVLTDTALPAPDQAWGAARAAKARQAARAEFDPATRQLNHLIECIAQQLPQAIFMGDSTQPVYAGNLGFNPAAVRRWFNASTGYGTLGWGLPAALGACLAAPGQPVVALVGDGGLLFTVAELAAAVEARLPVIVLLWNNQGYGEIRKYMLRHKVTPIGVELFTPDFKAMARAFGCSAEQVGNPAELAQALHASQGRQHPTLIEIDEAVWLAGGFE